MKQSMTYGHQNFNMYGGRGRGFPTQQMPDRQPQMRGGWTMMPSGFRSMQQHAPYMQPPMNTIPRQLPPTRPNQGDINQPLTSEFMNAECFTNRND